MLEMISAFRHAPQKSTLLPMQIPKGILWRKEPAVTGHRRLTYENHKLGRTIDVPVSATPAVLKDIGVVVASDDGFVRLFGPGLEMTYWERRLPASIYASLVVDHDRSRIIVAATSGDIAAFDLRGTPVWTRKLGRPVFATPALNAGFDTLVIAAFGHKAVGLSLEDGSPKFERDLPAPWHAERGGKAAHRNPYASPAVTVDGRSIFSAGQSVVCLDVTGQTLWQTDLPAEIKASPILATDLNMAVIATVAGACHLLNLETGARQSCIELDSKVTASGALSGDRVAIGTTSGRVSCIDLRKGQILWEAQHGAPRSYTSFTLSPKNDFIATGFDGNVICRDSLTGKFLWESSQVMGLPDHETPMDITPVASVSGRMYCASYRGDLYEFSFDQQEEERP